MFTSWYLVVTNDHEIMSLNVSIIVIISLEIRFKADVKLFMSLLLTAVDIIFRNTP